MIWCALQYVACFTNVIVMAAFAVQSLFCRPRGQQFEMKIKVLIVMPFLATLLTACVAFYYLVLMERAQCIYFGSTVAMVAIDIEQQIIFIIGIFFINTVQVVLKKTQALNQAASDRAQSAKEIAQLKR